jgi:hypothetical protein
VVLNVNEHINSVMVKTADHKMTIEKLTHLVLGERLTTFFDSKRLVDWAVDLLKIGCDSESLIILAGLDYDTTEDREKFFEETIKELKISINKSDSELIEMYAVHLSEQVVSGLIAPRKGLSAMLNVVHSTDYSKKYSQFLSLDEDIDYLHYSPIAFYNSGLNRNNIDGFIKTEFELFLRIHNNRIDDSYYDKSFCNNCKQINQKVMKTKYQLKRPFKYQVFVCGNCGSENNDSFSSQAGRIKILDKLFTP